MLQEYLAWANNAEGEAGRELNRKGKIDERLPLLVVFPSVSKVPGG